jgi:hypothetical protein
MLNQSGAMRVMAERYLRLAKTTKDPRERSKFFDYAFVYAQLSEQAERRETYKPLAGGETEHRNVPGRGDVVSRPRGR